MATTPVAASTPSPSSHIRTPPTPRLGFADSWEPFSPRKSSRIANAKTAAGSSSTSTTSARTPSPSSATRRAARLLRSPRQTQTKPSLPVQEPVAFNNSSVFSPAPTPRKKRTMPTAHFLSPEDSHKAAKTANGEGSSSQARMMGMLPTPAKTPSKKVHAASQNESNIAAIARNLFHNDVDEVMASPSKTPSRKGKKYTGISLESFTVVEQEDPISIFTDSQDRVPEADISNDNPFFGGGAVTAPSDSATPRRRSKRNHVSIPGEGKQSVDEATRREDGLVYVFRGKKIFRKFDESVMSQEEDVDSVSSVGKRLTRSAIKPRLLFPRSAQSPQLSGTPEGLSLSEEEDDEEAVTDIEDHILEDAEDVEEAEEDDLQAPLEQPEELEMEPEAITTPKAYTGKAAPNTPPNAPSFASSYAPDTPPVTVRATRSGHKVASTPEDMTPVKAPAKKRSPFDGWRQTKSSASSAGHKRQAEELGTAIGGPKRTRF